ILEMTKYSTIFIPLELEDALILTQRIMFCISSCLHVPAMICLLKGTPLHQADIKANLVLIQIAVIISDVYEAVLFEPVPVAEALTIYCKGLLCTVVRIQVLMGVLILVNAGYGVVNIACVLKRHQAMMPNAHALKLRKVESKSVNAVATL
ncbi:hypothetical protein PENTCL1PPCAC_14225, partial [Pristionchus entomophagus]